MATHEEMQTMADFLTSYPVALTWEKSPANPDMQDGSDMYHYHVKLSLYGRVMSTFYSKGRGHATPNPRMPKDAHLHIIGGKARTLYGEELLRRYPPTPTPPTVEEVLDCLASDAAGVEEARDFAEWASNYGYAEDSRKALTAYESCQRESRNLRALLGREAYRTLLDGVERL